MAGNIVNNTENTKRNKSVAFKNNPSFMNGISKVNGTLIDNAEDLVVVMPMCICLNTAKIREKQQRVCNYYRHEPSNPLSSNSKSFKYKRSITGNTHNFADGEAGYDASKVGQNAAEVVIPLKHLSKFLENFKYTVD